MITNTEVFVNTPDVIFKIHENGLYQNSGKSLLTEKQAYIEYANMLANEKFTTSFEDVPTASFSPAERKLTLPIELDLPKYSVKYYNDIYLAFCVHEICHALFTPVNYLEQLKFNAERRIGKIRDMDLLHTCYNIVEDIRIENLIKGQYPNVIMYLEKGFMYLLTTVNSVTTDKLNLLNICGKTHPSFIIEAEKHHQTKVTPIDWNQIRATITKCRLGNVSSSYQTTIDIYEQFVSQSKSGLLNKNSNSKDKGNGSEHQEKGNGSKFQEPMSGSGIKIDGDGEPDDSKCDNGSSSSNKIDRPVGYPTQSGSGSTSSNGIKILPVNHGNVTTLPKFNSIEELRSMFPRDHEFYKPKSFLNMDLVATAIKNADVMVAVYQREKAARDLIKGEIHNRGKIDMNKVWSYKLTDDIFLTDHEKREFKNHKVRIGIDCSGSIVPFSEVLFANALSVALFCKRVSVPVEIYTFTNGSYQLNNKMNLLSGSVRINELRMERSMNINSICELFMNTEKYFKEKNMFQSTPLSDMVYVFRELAIFDQGDPNTEFINVIVTDGECTSPKGSYLDSREGTSWTSTTNDAHGNTNLIQTLHRLHRIHNNISILIGMGSSVMMERNRMVPWIHRMELDLEKVYDLHKVFSEISKMIARGSCMT